MSIRLVFPDQLDHLKLDHRLHLHVKINHHTNLSHHTNRSHQTIDLSCNTNPHQLSSQLDARLPWIAQTSNTAQHQAWFRKLQWALHHSKKCFVCHWLIAAIPKLKRLANVVVIQTTLIHGQSVVQDNMFPRNSTVPSTVEHTNLNQAKTFQCALKREMKVITSHSHQRLNRDCIYHQTEFNLWISNLI